MRALLFISVVLGLAPLGCYDAREAPAEAKQSCEGCHGGGGSLAPPPGVWIAGGKSATTERGVGAHRAHLEAQLTVPARCDACHVVPKKVDDPGHMDTALPAEVTFGGLALARDTSASWDGTTCTVYCHAGKLPGGSNTRPRWTRVDGSQAACGTCHGLPPGGSHPQVAGVACSVCHDRTVDAAGKIVDPELHINGVVETKGTGGCSACHGSADSAAPPVDTKGKSATSERGVGAHQAHVRASTRHAALDCGACHVKPVSAGDAGHMDGKVQVVFGALAKTTGKVPAWDTTALRCGQAYCHSLDGGGNPTPAWAQGERMVCGSCHGLPPSKGRSGAAHPPSSLASCSNCHKGVVDSVGQIVNPGRHVDGKVDFN
jgi:predicted CxxxxCH...CXXCH cytochrome family protein